MERIFEKIEEAEKIIRGIDHIIYVTYPLIKENRLLITMVVEMKRAILLLINSILQVEYLHKRISLSQNPEKNLNTFLEKCAPYYDLTKNDTNMIIELFNIVEKHKKSLMGFTRNSKFVILYGDMKICIVSLEKTKEFLYLSKKILENSKKSILQ
jgi:hypothetical protein